MMRFGTAAGALTATVLLAGAGPAMAQARSHTTMMMAHQEASVTILSPMKGDKVGSTGWDVELQVVMPAKSMIPVMPGIDTSMDMMAGPSKAFPGLVVTDSSTAPKMGGPSENLAGLFQVVGERHDAKGDVVVDATWFVGHAMSMGEAMCTIRAYVVSGKAPAKEAMAPTDKAMGGMVGANKLVSNVAAVTVSSSAMSSKM